MKRDEHVARAMREGGVSRRDFMKFCTLLSATMGLSPSFVPRIARALTTAPRPPVVWLAFAECTGCAESTFRTTYPWFDQFLLEIVSMDFHETLMAPSGEGAKKSLQDTLKKHEGAFFCVVDGAIPTADNGVYGMVGGRTMLEIAREVCPKALATLCVGTCSSYGGIPAAAPNPTGAKSVKEALGLETVNIPGCPPNPINFVGTVVNHLLFGKLPQLDHLGRPLFAYGKTVHDLCHRRSHFEWGEFATSFQSPEAEKGYCLYELGCKGPETHNNCPLVKFNEGTSWPVQAGHPCIGCSEPGFWDRLSPFYKPL